jgi:hypothetical protein
MVGVDPIFMGISRQEGDVVSAGLPRQRSSDEAFHEITIDQLGPRGSGEGWVQHGDGIPDPAGSGVAFAA